MEIIGHGLNTGVAVGPTNIEMVNGWESILKRGCTKKLSSKSLYSNQKRKDRS